MTTYVSEVFWGIYNENCKIVYAGSDKNAAIQAINDYKIIQLINFADVSEWINGKYINQFSV